ncbi:MAG: DUF3343 domain-containing protein [Defluviitaleaceae bacterium]|nr:DUF3343 domain-containing protein [Defluviitaleaceae bacterium]
MYKLYTFNSTHQALFMERILSDNKILSKMIPTPRKLSASCGFALRISLDDFEKVSELIIKNEISTNGIYDFD